MQNAISPRGWRRVFIGILVIVILVALYLFVSQIPRTLSIFLIAAFIAFGVQPVCSRLERHMPKALAIGIVFALLLLLVAIGLVVIVPLTIAQLQVLVANAPVYISTMQAWYAQFEDWTRAHIPGLHMPADAFDAGALSMQHLQELATGTLTSLGAFLIGAATAFFVAFSSIVLSFFFLLNDTQISESFASMFPIKRRETARIVASEITATFGSYIAGQVIVSAITAIVVTIASAVLGFRFSLILGIITFVGYSVPVIGMLVVQAIAVVLCAPQGGWMMLWIQIVLFSMARVSDNVLVPRIMGKSVGVSPIGVMFAVFAGGEMFGLPGLLLGIPAAAVIRIIWKYFVGPWVHAQLDHE